MRNILLTSLLIIIAGYSYSQNEYKAYFGNLHSHTSLSDGEGLPNEAYSYAKDSAGIDFLAITDHQEQLSDNEYIEMQNAADNASINGTFIGIAGYEWSSPYYGHVNVFNTPEMPALSTYANWSGFREWLIEHPEAFAQFNHPGDESYFNNWYDFEYKGIETDNSFPLLEVQNIQQATDWYETALNNGWHVSPVWNQDNHSPDWGNKNSGRAGIWCDTLTREAIFEAINSGRTFATMDKNFSIMIKNNNIFMGDETYPQNPMSITISLNDDDYETVSTLEVVGSSGVITTLGDIETNTEINVDAYINESSYVFVRAIQEDGDYVWSAPIYINPELTNVQINSLEQEVILYPNPAKSNFHIQSNHIIKKISIISMQNKEVLIKTINTKSIKIKVDNLKKGIYIIIITDKNNNQIKKRLTVV